MRGGAGPPGSGAHVFGVSAGPRRFSFRLPRLHAALTNHDEMYRVSVTFPKPLLLVAPPRPRLVGSMDSAVVLLSVPKARSWSVVFRLRWDWVVWQGRYELRTQDHNRLVSSLSTPLLLSRDTVFTGSPNRHISYLFTQYIHSHIWPLPAPCCGR